MSSLGQLVAGIAHEINNPVSFIYGNIRYASDYTLDLLSLINLYQCHYPEPVDDIRAKIEAVDLAFLTEDFPKLLASMEMGAERIQEIVLSLRTFSRMDESDMKSVNIHDGIESTLLILQNRIKPNSTRSAVEIVRRYGDLPSVECYASQLNQVFMNLLVNAIDAIDEAIAQEKIADSARICIQTDQIKAGIIRIEITDNGPGIPQPVRERLFDPFFTTKPVGKGTGLGLSISYKIVVETHQGKMWCQSQPGQGTSFFLEIPITVTPA